jgi:hypothetical protein
MITNKTYKREGETMKTKTTLQAVAARARSFAPMYSYQIQEGKDLFGREAVFVMLPNRAAKNMSVWLLSAFASLNIVTLKNRSITELVVYL